MTIEQAIATLPSGTVKLWDPDHPGTYVLAPLPFWQVLGNGAYAYSPALAREALGACIAAGWLVEQPEAAMRQRVTRVCKRIHVNQKTGKQSTAIDFYGDGLQWAKYKMTTVYLDDAERRDAFEAASGLSVDDLPLWEGENPLTPTGAAAPRYLVATSFWIQLRDNPDYDPSAEPKTPRHYFGGYLDSQNGQQPPSGQPELEQEPQHDGETLETTRCDRIRARKDDARTYSLWLIPEAGPEPYLGINDEQSRAMVRDGSLSSKLLTNLSKSVPNIGAWSPITQLLRPVEVRYVLLDGKRGEVRELSAAQQP